MIRWPLTGIVLAASLVTATSPAQVRAGRPTAPASPPQGDEPSTELRARFGAERAARLLKSEDPSDRLRAIARAGAVQTPEGLALLVDATKPLGVSRTDPRVMIEVARALASYTDQASARDALLRLIDAPLQAASPRASGGARNGEAPFDVEAAGRTRLAREIAALAVASAGDARSVEALVALARGGGPGQAAARKALEAFPPSQPSAFGPANIAAPAVLELIAHVGDLRPIPAIHPLLKASDPSLRIEALRTLGLLGDSRVVAAAEAAIDDPDPRMRVAAADALVALQATSRFRAVERLLRDDETAAMGVRLAERGASVAAVELLAARAAHPPASWDAATRSATVAVLGRLPHDEAVQTLAALTKDPWLQGDAADALARSSNPRALTVLEDMARDPARRGLAARAYVVHALVRGGSSGVLDALLRDLAASPDGRARAIGVGALVALGDRSVASGLSDADPRVRRAAAVAALAHPTPAALRALRERARHEPDEATRRTLAIGLLDGDVDGQIPTLALVNRAEAGGPDAPLAAFALARRRDDSNAPKVAGLLASLDPLVRAHTARGLGASPGADALGLLVGAYAYEVDPIVRRGCIEAVAARPEREAPLRQSTLRTAARLDPDPLVRAISQRALAGYPNPPASMAREVAWLRIVDADGRPPPGVTLGAVLRADGKAVPFAFDEDGYALIPGMPPGEARLVLAPRLPAYDPQHP